MGVAFHDCQRGVKEEPEQQVAQLTQPSPFDRDDLAVYEAQTLFIGLLIVGMADELPEGESLPGRMTMPSTVAAASLRLSTLLRWYAMSWPLFSLRSKVPAENTSSGRGAAVPRAYRVPVQPHPQVKPFDLKEATQGG